MLSNERTGDSPRAKAERIRLYTAQNVSITMNRETIHKTGARALARPIEGGTPRNTTVVSGYVQEFRVPNPRIDKSREIVLVSWKTHQGNTVTKVLCNGEQFELYVSDEDALRSQASLDTMERDYALNDMLERTVFDPYLATKKLCEMGAFIEDNKLIGQLALRFEPLDFDSIQISN